MVIFILIKNKYAQLQTRVPDPGRWQYLSFFVLRLFLGEYIGCRSKGGKKWVSFASFKEYK